MPPYEEHKALKALGICAYCGLKVAEPTVKDFGGTKRSALMALARARISAQVGSWEAPNSIWLHNKCASWVKREIQA